VYRQGTNAHCLARRAHTRVLSTELACAPRVYLRRPCRLERTLCREEQDAFAAESHKKAAAATAAGKFRDEIVPVKTTLTDPKTKETKDITVTVDDGIRQGVSAASLGKLKPAFKAGGSTTAGNSSQARFVVHFAWIEYCMCQQ
jgi:Thiolase, N-terminal domain